MKVAKWVEAPTGTFIKQSAKTGKRYVEDIFFIHTHLMWLLHVFWPHNRRHTCRLWVERGVTFENSSKRDPVCLVFLFSCYARVHTPPHPPRITTGRQQRMLLLSFLVFYVLYRVNKGTSLPSASIFLSYHFRLSLQIYLPVSQQVSSNFIICPKQHALSLGLFAAQGIFVKYSYPMR